MPAGSKPGLTQKSLSSIAVVASSDLAGQLVEGDELALEVAEARQLDLAGPVVDDRLLLERDVRQRRDGVGQTLGVVVVRAHRHDRAAPREEAAGAMRMTRKARRTWPMAVPVRPCGRRWSALRWRWRRARLVCI